MSDNQIDPDNKHPGSIANFIKRHLVLFLSLFGSISFIIIIEYYPIIAETGSQIFHFCEKCWGIFNQII